MCVNECFVYKLNTVGRVSLLVALFVQIILLGLTLTKNDRGLSWRYLDVSCDGFGQGNRNSF